MRTGKLLTRVAITVAGVGGPALAIEAIGSPFAILLAGRQRLDAAGFRS